MATDAFSSAADTESAAYAAAPQAALPYDPSDPGGELGAPAVYAMQPSSTAPYGPPAPTTPTDSGTGNAQFFSSKGTFYRVAMAPYRTPPLYTLQGLTNFDLEDAQQDNQTGLARETRNNALADQYDQATQNVLTAFPPSADRKTAVDWGVDTTFDGSQDTSNVTDPGAVNESLRAQYLNDAANAYNTAAQSNTAQDLQADQNTAATREARTNVPILMTGIRIGQRDITSEMPCLGNVKVFYVFGQAFGQIQVAGEILLGPLGNEKSEGLKRLVDFFNKYRVSNYGKTIFATVENHHYQLYVTGLMVGEVNTEMHIMPFGVVGTLIDPSNTGDALVNWTPKVNDAVEPNLSDTGALAEILGKPLELNLLGAPQEPKVDSLLTPLTGGSTSTDLGSTNLSLNLPVNSPLSSSTFSMPAGDLSALNGSGPLSFQSQAGQASGQALALQGLLQQQASNN